jgi:hypothetical protein
VRSALFALLVLAECDLAGPPSPWARATLLAEGAERVDVESRLVPTMRDPEIEYKISFSHDGGRTFTRATEGKIEGFQRRHRAYRLPSGLLGVGVFVKACAETSPGRVVCDEFYDDRALPGALHPVLAGLARDRDVETYVRVRAASSLAKARAPGAAALLATMLTDGTSWGRDEADSLRAASAGLPHE